MTSSMRSAFLSSGLLALAVLCAVIRPGDCDARESGIQLTPDQKRILVNKDVGASRFVITQNRDDGSTTGNVFFTDDRSPTFLYCEAEGGLTFACSSAEACPSTGRQSGIQRRPDGRGILVSKTAGDARFAITQNGDGSLTGNVFFPDGRSPSFIFCQPQGGTSYSCSGADSCAGDACPSYGFIANIDLPADFFTVPTGCPGYTGLGDVTLPDDFFTPTTRANGSSAEIFGGVTKVQPQAGSAASLRRGIPPISRAGAPATITGVDAQFQGFGGAQLVVPLQTAALRAPADVHVQGAGEDVLIVAAARADGSLMEGFYELPLSGSVAESLNVTFATSTSVPLLRLATRIGGVVSTYESLLVSFTFSSDTPLLAFQVTATYPVETGAFVGRADSVSCRIPALGIGIFGVAQERCRPGERVSLLANNKVDEGELILQVVTCDVDPESPNYFVPFPIEVVCAFAAAEGQALAPTENISVEVTEVVIDDPELGVIDGDPDDLDVATDLAVRQ